LTLGVSQNSILQNNINLAQTKIESEFYYFIYGKYPSLVDNYNFNLYYKSNYIYNLGHSNIDNNSEIYSQSRITQINSFRFILSSNWYQIEIEPYKLDYSDDSKNYISSNNPLFYYGTFGVNNNTALYKQKKMGFRQSRVILHHKGIGISYGNMSHWWGPGFHSSLTLSSNADSQTTYSIGTFKDISFGSFSLNSQAIVMPYKSFNGTKLYLSGLKGELTYKNDPEVTLGFNRVFQSGNFDFISPNVSSWTIKDAFRLVFEPLFGQSKKGLDYTLPNTPGFDIWDEILSGYFKLFFRKINFEIYANVASDDSRANFTDLRAHWDHTLAYLIGFKKFSRFDRIHTFFGVEYLTTRISNTFKPEFFRGDEPANYYSNPIFDYFSYNGRRIAAHSGSSSDDFVINFGVNISNISAYLMFNKERHAIKAKRNPEEKNEISIHIKNQITDNSNIYISLESELINNSRYESGKISSSIIYWIGYSFSLK
tara:strand:+ start:3305 stop:4753 length:1449 start_codon:yes stop_codon:yes gene_type:complete